MKGKRKLWIMAVTLACFLMGSLFLLSPSSADRLSRTPSGPALTAANQTSATVKSSGKITLRVSGRYQELQFVDAADLPEYVGGMSSDAKPVALTQADVNQDGQPDLVGAYAGSNGSELRVRLGSLTGDISLPQVYGLEGLTSTRLAYGDLNNDGIQDIAVSTVEGKVGLFLGGENGQLNYSAPINVTGSLGAMVVSDINRDGIDDLLVVDREGNTVKWLVGNGDLANAKVKIFAPELSNISEIAVSDFDNDFRRDIAIAGSNGVVILYGSERDEFKREVRLPFSGDVKGIAVKDFNSDYYPDLAVSGSNGITVWNTRLEKGFSKGRIYLAGRPVGALSTGDYNRDGRFDLSVIDADKVSVLLNNGKGFGKALPMDVVGSPLTIASGDFRRHGGDGIAIGKADGGLVMAIAPQAITLNVSTLNDENDCPTCTSAQLTALKGPLGAPGGSTGISLREALTAINNDFVLNGKINQGIGFGTLSTTSGPPPAANVETDPLSTCGGNPVNTYWFIFLGAPLPPILAPGTTIDGTVVNTVSKGGPGNTLGPKVVLSGSGIVVTSSAPGAIIKGLGIINAPGNAITVASSNNQILNNVVGYDCDTVTPASNLGIGILLTGASNTQVVNNFVGSNTSDGIQINGISLSIPIPQNNLIDRNNIGLNRLGNKDILGNVGNANGNALDGIRVQKGATGNTITNNNVGGNGGFGIHVMDNITSDTFIRSNRVGIDPSGQSGRANGLDGVAISDVGNSKFNQISQNLISGNFGNGLSISSADTQAQFNVATNNKIGVNSTGSVQVPNLLAGVLIRGSANGNTIGGAQRAAFNQISGNNGVGVRIGAGGGPNNNVIQFNDIGPNNLITGAPFDPLDPSAPQPRSNKGGGVVIDGTSFSNIIAQNNIAFNNDTAIVPVPAPNPAILCSGIRHQGTGNFNTFTQNNIFLNPPNQSPVTPNISVINGAEGLRNTMIVAPPSLTSLIEINSVVTVTATGQTTVKGTINYLNNGILANINQSTIEIFVSRRGAEYTSGPVANVQRLSEGQLYLNALVSFQPNPQNINTLDWSASLIIPAQFLDPVQTNTVYVTATTTTGDGSTSPFSLGKVPQFVSGVGQCTLSVNPNPISFDNAPVGVATAQDVTLTNTGNSLISISSLGINQSGTKFSVVPKNPNTLPFTLSPNQSATITVTFTPTDNSSQSAQLVIGDSCNGQTFIPISGQGCQPTIQVNPTSVNFGTIQVGNTATATVQVANVGCPGSTLLFTASLSNNTPSAFSITNVRSGSPANVDLAFNPLNPGTFNGTLVISSTNASNSPVNVPLTGQATQPQQPNLVVLPANVIFGDVPVGTTATQAITIRNAGNAPLNISTPVVQTGANLGFGVSAPPTLTILPNEFTTVQVSFTPNQTGQANGSILVSSNAGSQTVVLTGNGVAARIVVSPASIDFGASPVGQPAQARTLTISNTGTGPLEVRSFSISGGTANGFSLPNTASFTVQPGSSGAISVAFTPNRVGPTTDTLVISSNDPTSPTVTVTLNGSGSDNIPPTVSVQAPTSGQGVGAGQSFTVRFTAADNIGLSTFEIRLSTNGGGSFDSTIGSGNAVAGTNTFTATAPVGANTSQAVVQVLVRDTNNNVGTATSSSFVIAPPPNIFGPSLVGGKFKCVASGSNIQPGAVLVIGNDTFPLSANSSGSKFLVKKSVVGSGGRTLSQLVPKGATVQVAIRNPNGITSAPASVTAQ